MKKFIIAAVGLVLAGPAFAQTAATPIDPAALDAAVKAGWKELTPELQKRVDQDETQKVCSDTRNNPSKAQFDAIVAREKATIEYPPDGKLLGDWEKGKKSAGDGFGWRMRDDMVKRQAGGNCYACHQMEPKEITYGTLGPSLVGYGKLRDFKEEAANAAYEKIYTAHVVFPCSNMPRLGANKFLTIDQIKDVTAFLMSPDSPVNK
ncbi:MAG: sulfur oxidation c-type cytochrome SoxX [Hyphomicrobium sp.]